MTPAERSKLERIMKRGEARAVALVASGGRRSVGEVRVQRWTPRERALRAVAAWAACWGLGAVSVLLPAAHFVLVPIFLVAGPIAAYLRARAESSVLGGTAPCPACGQAFVVDPAPERWPLKDVCGACRVQVAIEPER